MAEPKSEHIRNDVTNFNNNLSASDTTVQKALETLDDITIVSAELDPNAWLKTGDQSGLTGTKSGTYTLTTTGFIKSERTSAPTMIADYGVKGEYKYAMGATDVIVGTFGYAVNTGSTVGTTGHFMGFLGLAEDTVNGKIDMYGIEGRANAKGSAGSVYGSLGLGTYAGTTFAGRLAVGQVGRVEITTDGTTPLAEGLATAFYAPAIIGGAATTKYSFFGYDPLTLQNPATGAMALAPVISQKGNAYAGAVDYDVDWIWGQTDLYSAGGLNYSLKLKSAVLGGSYTAGLTMFDMFYNGQFTLVGGGTINSGGADIDTIIQGDTDATLIVVDAGLDYVGIGMTPVAGEGKLQVTGNQKITGNLTATGNLNTSNHIITEKAGNYSAPYLYKEYGVGGSARNSIAVDATYIYGASTSGSLQIYSRSTGLLVLSESISSQYSILKRVGNYLYNASSAKFEIWDITGLPTSITKTGSYTYATNNVYDLDVLGTLAIYTENYTIKGVSIADISNPASPSKLATYNPGVAGDMIMGTRFINATTIAVSIQDGAAPYNNNRVEIVDITTPASPTLITTIVVGDGSTAYQPPPKSLAVSGNTLFVTGGGWLLAYDVTTPATPTLLDSSNNGGGLVALNGNYLNAVAWQSTTIYSYDISDPSDITYLGSTDVGVGTYDAYADSSNLWLGDYNGTISMLERSGYQGVNSLQIKDNGGNVAISFDQLTGLTNYRETNFSNKIHLNIDYASAATGFEQEDIIVLTDSERLLPIITKSGRVLKILNVAGDNNIVADSTDQIITANFNGTPTSTLLLSGNYYCVTLVSYVDVTSTWGSNVWFVTDTNYMDAFPYGITIGNLTDDTARGITFNGLTTQGSMFYESTVGGFYFSHPIFDNSGFLTSINPNLRTLNNSSGDAIFDWENMLFTYGAAGTLWDMTNGYLNSPSDFSLVANLETRILYASDGTSTRYNWETNQIFDSSASPGLLSIDPNNRVLVSNNGTINGLDFATPNQVILGDYTHGNGQLDFVWDGTGDVTITPTTVFIINGDTSVLSLVTTNGIYDTSSSALSIDTNNRQLFDVTGIGDPIIDWTNSYVAGAFISFDAGSVVFTNPIEDTSLTSSIDTNNRILYSPLGDVLIDFSGNVNASASLYFEGAAVTFPLGIQASGDGQPSVDPNTRILTDSSGMTSANWDERELWASDTDGNYPAINWTTVNTIRIGSLNSISYLDLIFQASDGGQPTPELQTGYIRYQPYDKEGFIFEHPILDNTTNTLYSIDPSSRELWDSSEAVAINWESRLLLIDALNYAADWSVLGTFKIGDESNLYEQYLTFAAYDGASPQTGYIMYRTNDYEGFVFEHPILDNVTDTLYSIKPDERELWDSNETLSADWENRILYDTDGTTPIISFGNGDGTVTLPTGLTGALVGTAGVVSAVTPVADGTYCTGIGGTTNGSITVSNGIIISITEAVA